MAGAGSIPVPTPGRPLDGHAGCRVFNLNHLFRTLPLLWHRGSPNLPEARAGKRSRGRPGTRSLSDRQRGPPQARFLKVVRARPGVTSRPAPPRPPPAHRPDPAARPGVPRARPSPSPLAAAAPPGGGRAADWPGWPSVSAARQHKPGSCHNSAGLWPHFLRALRVPRPAPPAPPSPARHLPLRGRAWLLRGELALLLPPCPERSAAGRRPFLRPCDSPALFSAPEKLTALGGAMAEAAGGREQPATGRAPPDAAYRAEEEPELASLDGGRRRERRSGVSAVGTTERFPGASLGPPAAPDPDACLLEAAKATPRRSSIIKVRACRAPGKFARVPPPGYPAQAALRCPREGPGRAGQGGGGSPPGPGCAHPPRSEAPLRAAAPPAASAGGGASPSPGARCPDRAAPRALHGGLGLLPPPPRRVGSPPRRA